MWPLHEKKNSHSYLKINRMLHMEKVNFKLNLGGSMTEIELMIILMIFVILNTHFDYKVLSHDYFSKILCRDMEV